LLHPDLGPAEPEKTLSSAKVGTAVTLLIVAGVGAIFLLNREPTQAPPRPTHLVPPRPGSLEHPIGDDVVKHHINIAAVWLPAVGMAGMPEPLSDVIHLEADIHATADNPNGFAKDEFVPYLKIKYELSDAKGGKPLQAGDLMPMVASDGLHYGANIAKPGPGSYRLVYKIEPPSAGGLGRHVDAATGVAAWWEPFEVGFDWTMEAERPQAVAGTSGRP
jgi:periplasmic iron binding protein